jgi:biopolymer transport protein ExbD
MSAILTSTLVHDDSDTMIASVEAIRAQAKKGAVARGGERYAVRIATVPKASATPSLAKPQTKAITVREDGQVFLDAYPVTMQELEERLRQARASNPELPVLIKGDAKVQYEKVVDVLDLMGQLEITNLGLVTARPGR